jgi:hypothetical protein
MDKDYTSLAIRHLYQETTLLEAFELEQELSIDEELREVFEELQEGYQILPKVLFLPSDRSIENLLAYSRQSAPIIA